MRVRAALLLVLLVVGLGLLLTRCPANRDGMPGQLAQAMEETTAAARSRRRWHLTCGRSSAPPRS